MNRIHGGDAVALCQTVGLLQFDGYSANDILYYESQAGLPYVPLINVLVDGATGAPSGSGGEVEVSLDIEMVISMAPGVSEVVLFEAGRFKQFIFYIAVYQKILAEAFLRPKTELFFQRFNFVF